MTIVPAQQRGGRRKTAHEPGMAAGRTDDKPAVRLGQRAFGSLIASVARPALRSRPANLARLLADWPEIVGPTLAMQTLPRRLAGTTLTLACAGPIALELQHLSGPLAQRINAHAGRVLVEGFRFVQSEVPVAAGPPSRPRRRGPARAIDITILPAGDLRDALAALAAAVAEEEDSGAGGR